VKPVELVCAVRGFCAHWECHSLGRRGSTSRKIPNETKKSSWSRLNMVTNAQRYDLDITNG
jgi:hypothetical protein